MATLDDLFNRYGHPSDEWNATKHFYYTRADCIRRIEDIQHADKKAQRDIAELLQVVELLQEYRRKLHERAQAFFGCGFSLLLKIWREVNYYNNKKFYFVEIQKTPDVQNAAPMQLLQERYEGKERHKAIARFEELKKLYPNIPTEKDINKSKWER